jgi:apolipoprotein N-acyltransferase
VQHGATLLATLTNDAWYGDTAAPWQHLRAAQFRAAELRRPLLRAAITGVSAIIEPDGSLRSSLGPGEEGVLAGTVRGRTDRSPYSRAPWTPVWASLAIVAAILLVAKEAR